MSSQNAAPSTWLGTARIGPRNTVFTASDGDLWPSCWAADDAVYTAWGDGHGFEPGAGFVDVGTARLTGELTALVGENLAKGDDVCQLWSPAGYTRKPTGIVCVGNRLHLAVQDLAWDFRDAPSATISTSDDGGRTWTWNRSGPMFSDHVFTTIWFADFGRGGALGPAGGPYVYAYGLDGNWRASYGAVSDPVDVFLARVHRDDVADRTAWEFYCGDDEAGPAWSPSIAAKTPVLHDDRRVYARGFSASAASDSSVVAQGGVLYNQALDRFLYVTWSEWVHIIYESPTPWGPWRRGHVRDYTARNELEVQYGGYGTSFPSKFVSPNGLELMLQSNRCCGIPCPAPSYNFSMRPLELTVRATEQPVRAVSGIDLAREPDAVLISKSVRQGTLDALTDQDPTSGVDDDDGEAKDVSWWGVQWSEPHLVSTVTLTTGETTDAGGWFVTSPRVEILADDWCAANGQIIDRPFICGREGSGQTYEIAFAPTECYGVRIVGSAGGDRRFTSLAQFGAGLTVGALRDPGFEQSVEPWGTWQFEGGAPREIVTDPQRAHNGQRFAMLHPEPATGRHGVAQTIATVPGQLLEVRAWLRAVGGISTTYIGIRNGAEWHVGHAAPAAYGTYELVTHEVVVPAGCHTCEVVVGMEAGTPHAELAIDDVEVTQLANPLGDHPDAR